MQIILILIFICFFSVFSQETKNLEKQKEIEVVATKKNDQITRAKSIDTNKTGFVTIISSKSFEGKYSSLPEVLEKEAGVHINHYGGLGSYSNISIRGSNSNQVRIFINGIPINNNMGGEINIADFNLENLEQIEVYKSGSSFGFSNSAIGGVVNLVTKTKKTPNISKINAGVGSFNTYKMNVANSGSVKNLNYNLFLQKEKSDQDYIYKNDNGTPVINSFDDKDELRKNSQFDRINFNSNGNLIFKKTNFTGLTDFYTNTNGIPGPGSSQTKKLKRKFSRGTISLGNEYKGLFFDSLNFSTKVFFVGSNNHIFDPLNEFKYGVSNSKANTEHFGLQLSPEIYLIRYFQIIRIYSSIEKETFQLENRNNLDETTSKNPKKFRNHNTYQIQDEIRILKKRLIIQPALQYEEFINRYNDTSYKTINFKRSNKTKNYLFNYKIGFLGILYSSEKLQFNLKSNYSKESRVPDFLELFGESGSVIGNPELKPEKSTNVDLGNIVDIKLNKIKLNSEITFFSKTIKDLILFVPNSQFTLRPENIDSAKIQGLEFIHFVKIFEIFEIKSNFTYQKAINTSNVSYLKGKYLPMRPMLEWKGLIGFDYSFIKLGLEGNYIGATFKDRSNEYFNYQPPRWIYNFYITLLFNKFRNAKFLNEFYLTFEIKNISNKRAFDIIGYPLPGRSYYLSTGLKF